MPGRLSKLGILQRVPRPEAPTLLLGLWLLTFFFRLFYSFGHGYGGAFSNANSDDANVANLIESFGKLGAYFIFSALVIWLARSRRFGRLQIWLALACLGLEVWINIVAGWKYSPVLFVSRRAPRRRNRTGRGCLSRGIPFSLSRARHTPNAEYSVGIRC